MLQLGVLEKGTPRILLAEVNTLTMCIGGVTIGPSPARGQFLDTEDTGSFFRGFLKVEARRGQQGNGLVREGQARSCKS